MRFNKEASEEENQIKFFSSEEILRKSKNEKKGRKFRFGSCAAGNAPYSRSAYINGVVKLWNEFKVQILSGAVTMAAAVAICVTVNTLDYSLGYEVIIDGENIGMVTNQQTVYSAISDVREDIAKYTDNTDFEKTPVFVRRLVSNKKLIDENGIRDALLSNVDAMVECYSIRVNDEVMLGVSSEKAAKWVLAQYKQKYTGEDITDDMVVDFCEKTEIKKEFLHIALLETPEEALATLSGDTKESGVYVVKENDTLWGIASSLGTTVEHLLALNENVSENIKAGLELKIEESVPKLSVKSVQTVSSVEEVPYEVEKIDDNTIYKDTTVVAQEGQNGQARVLAKVTKINGVEKSKDILESETLTAPVKRIEKVGTKERPATTGSGTFARPTFGSLSSRYGARWGRRHTGIDIAGSYNSDIKAADGGVVTYSGWMSGYGNYVVINHENGYQTGYGHCASLSVKVGDRVAKGDVIAKMGNTGRSTGTHLHFEVKKDGAFVDPLGYVGY